MFRVVIDVGHVNLAMMVTLHVSANGCYSARMLQGQTLVVPLHNVYRETMGEITNARCVTIKYSIHHVLCKKPL